MTSHPARRSRRLARFLVRGAPFAKRLLDLPTALALVGLLAACQAGAQYPNPGPASQPEGPTPGISASRPRFSTDATIQPGTGGQPEVRIDYRLARTELLFERSAAGYRAAYELRVAFYAEKGDRLVAGDSFTRELRVGRYAETTAKGEDVLGQVTFRIRPGKYRVEAALTDLVAERTSGTEFPFEVPSSPAGPVWFTDLTLGTLVPDSTGADGATQLRPNPSRRYGEDLPRIAVAGEIVDSRPAGTPDSIYRLRYEVLKDPEARIIGADTTLARRGTRTPFLLRPRVGSLDPGSYRVAVELVSPGPDTRGKKKVKPLRREKSFTVEQSASSVTIDPRSALDILRYIATDTERSEMDRLQTPDERQAYWEEFWRRRDPSPDSPQNEAQEEFYKRVQYANQHFGVGGPGWRTDMGRIYIRNGQPDEVVRNPFRFEGPPEEIWYYYRERLTYFFVDKDGFGRYILDERRSTKTD